MCLFVRPLWSCHGASGLQSRRCATMRSNCRNMAHQTSLFLCAVAQWRRLLTELHHGTARQFHSLSVCRHIRLRLIAGDLWLADSFNFGKASMGFGEIGFYGQPQKRRKAKNGPQKGFPWLLFLRKLSQSAQFIEPAMTARPGAPKQLTHPRRPRSLESREHIKHEEGEGG